MNMLNFLCVLVLARAAAVADAQCTASTDNTKVGTDGSFYCINGGTSSGAASDCTCADCDSGYSGTNCQTADACTPSTDSSKDGADGNFYCVNGGTVGGTTGADDCTCTGCDSGYSGTSCQTPNQVAANEKCGAADICPTDFYAKASAADTACAAAACDAAKDKNTCCTACAPVVNQKIAEPGPGLTCTDGTDSSVERCIDGYAPLAPTGDATAHTCTACNPVANANADAAPTCPDGKDTTQVDACAVGYWRKRTNTVDTVRRLLSTDVKDECLACPDDANKATGTTVSCDPNPNDLATIGNLRLHGFCKAGYHLVRGGQRRRLRNHDSSGEDDACTLCTATAACDEEGQFLHGCEADTVPTCKTCTAIANMASSGALTCTSQYDSKVTPATDAGCASQYSLIKVAVGAHGETHTCIDETHHSCAGTGPQDTGAGCENGNTPVGVSHAATRTTATLLLAGAMLAVTLIGR